MGVTLGYTDGTIAAQTGNPSRYTGLVTSIRDVVETRTTGYSNDALTGSPSSLTSSTVGHGGLHSRPR
ncbi:hypothetical protein [Modestobacter italicus]|uniref:hypothetical protein n=1 Tax=Modestobacter italicus (strain DSM 44449 / CECT 9708 / BC 501) TaxID=2732864 RepID=UPI0003045A8E|nr:hypothetical protein [Modestobacter marinus]